jgi:hypothetical protein
MRRNIGIYLGCLSVLIPSIVSFAEQTSAKEKVRRYSRGPLSIEEFRGTAINAEGRTALTATRIFCEYKFDVKVRGGRVVASLRSFTAFACFLPNDSWWNDRDNPQLLDHEQGHFDISEIQARRVNLTFAKLLASGRTISAEGSSASAVREKLEKQINDVVRKADKERDQANLDYDRTTRHGLLAPNQSEQRRIQRLTLGQLADELTAVESRRN